LGRNDVIQAGYAGVRSLAFSHHLLSVGGGHGKIHFYDLRAGKYLEADHAASWQPPGGDDRRQTHKPKGRTMGNFFLQTGEGHLARNEIYR